MGAAAQWIIAASPQALLAIAFITLVMLSAVLMLPRLARRLQETRGYAEIGLKAVGFHLKISFAPERLPLAEAEPALPDTEPIVRSPGNPRDGGAGT